MLQFCTTIHNTCNFYVNPMAFSSQTSLLCISNASFEGKTKMKPRNEQNGNRKRRNLLFIFLYMHFVGNVENVENYNFLDLFVVFPFYFFNIVFINIFFFQGKVETTTTIKGNRILASFFRFNSFTFIFCASILWKHNLH